MAGLAVTNMPPPYYTVYADAVNAPLAKQVEILSMPLRENVRANSTYVNTRRYLLGPDNPGFVMTPDGSGLGVRGAISAQALKIQAATTANGAEAARCRALAAWLAQPEGLSPRAQIAQRAKASIARAAALPHPRVFATAADFAALKQRAQTDALVKAGIDRALAEADRWQGRPVSRFELTGYHLLAVSRQGMSRLIANAFAYRMTGAQKYVDDAVKELRAVCAFPHWNPRHTIDTGEMMLAVATAYDWLYEALPADVREEAAAALETKGLRSEVPFAGWTRLQNNWVQVVSGGVTAAAVALAERQPELCAQYLAAVVEALPEAESVCGPDGVFPEGPGYWNYGWSFNAIALDVMRTAFGHDFELSEVPGLQATGLYPALVTGPSGDWFNYSDCHASRGSSPTVWWFARRFGNTAAVTAQEVASLRAVCTEAPGKLSRTFPFTLFWIGEDLAKDAAALPDIWVGQGEVPIGVLRAPQETFLALKGGSPAYNHGHADAGSFVLDMLGVRWGYDLGAEDYHQVEQHIGPSGLWSPEPDSQRWSVFRLGAQGHNTLMIGGKGQDSRGFATLMMRAGERIIADLSSVYPQARRVMRTVGPLSHRGLPSMTLTDVIEADPGTSVRWAMNTDAQIELGEKGAVTLRKNGALLRVSETSGAGVWSEGSAQPPNDWEQPNPGLRQLIYTVAVPSSGTLKLTVQMVGERARDLPVEAVDVFVGTRGTGHTTPAACRPFAMVQAGPDTGVLDWAHCSGYQYDDTSLLGFSSSHISGSGCTDLGDVLLLPFTRATIAPQEKLPMDKASEVASPGYYAVKLPTEGVMAEMTATKRVGYYRFDYGAAKVPRLLVDLQHGVVVFGENGMTNRVLACAAHVRPDLTGVSAALEVKCWTTRRSFEVVRFSRPAVRVTELPKTNSCERAPRYVFEFAPSAAPLEVKVALSTTGLDGADENLATELPKWNFDETRQAARDEWNRLLARAAVKGDARQRRLFYTALYHTAVQPHEFSDVSGAYRGADDQIHHGVRYGEMSLWDTYRAMHPLYTLVFPERVDGFVNSLVAQSQEQGYLPVWPLRGQETDCMIGNPAVSVIADAYLKGFRGFDVAAAWKEIVKSLENPRPNSRVDLVNKYGYFPLDVVKVESAAMTLEDAINCDGAAKLAAALGKTAVATHYARRAQNYRHLFDAETGFLRGRASDGAWRTPFDPLRICNAYALGGDFTEGNAWQYLWLVPHDVKGLTELLGGREKFLAKLDQLFALPSEPEGQPKLLDVTGLIGQYAHGNEPSQHIAYLYALSGRPARTQELVRTICDTFYSTAPDGICGNEDGGQMSAWYIFSAMGFYPVDPVGGEYVLGAPQLPEVEIDLGRASARLRIVAKNLSAQNQYVKSVTFNGVPVNGVTIRHEDLVRGGELIFEMCAEPR